MEQLEPATSLCSNDTWLMAVTSALGSPTAARMLQQNPASHSALCRVAIDSLQLSESIPNKSKTN